MRRNSPYSGELAPLNWRMALRARISEVRRREAEAQEARREAARQWHEDNRLRWRAERPEEAEQRSAAQLKRRRAGR